MDNQKNYFLPYDQIQALIRALQDAHYLCIGPQVRDGAIVYDTLLDAEQLPWGITDYQSPGQYRLEKKTPLKAFAWANGPQAIKPFLFKPSDTVWQVVKDANGKLNFKPHPPDEQAIAFFGARSCDLHAMAIQDKVFMENGHVDVRYQHRRKHLFVIAVNCTYASQNCFCVSAGTGPAVTSPYDILMTEIDNGFIIKTGSERGALIIAGLTLKLAQNNQSIAATDNVQNAATMQSKRIPFDNAYDLRNMLMANLEHPRWAEVADRCLSCGNCTSVCPTCFCHSETDVPSLDGTNSEHIREWDSCFTAGHSYVNGKVIRDDTRKRYRQWLTHKVGTWFDQFDTSGCVGCGRCISWCPVGIDLTEELAALSGESNKRGKQ